MQKLNEKKNMRESNCRLMTLCLSQTNGGALFDIFLFFFDFAELMLNSAIQLGYVPYIMVMMILCVGITFNLECKIKQF